MKYEVILKQRHNHNPYETKYHCIVSEDRLEFVKNRYEQEAKDIEDRIHNCECLVLINKLDDNGEFVDVIQ